MSEQDVDQTTKATHKSTEERLKHPTAHEIETVEPMLLSDPNRYVVFPLKRYDIWDMYKKAVASVWTVEEVDLSRDLADWKKLNVTTK